MNNLKKIGLEEMIVLWGIFIQIILIVFIFRSPLKTVYDEYYFLSDYKILLEKGWSRDYLINLNQSPGPLYQVFYLFINKLGIKVSVHLTRYFSLFFFDFGLWIFLKSFKRLQNENFWVIYFSIFSLPFIYPIIGMGLSETISMVFLGTSFYFFSKYTFDKKIYLLLLFSIFYSIAVVGRQNFLITYPLFLLFSVANVSEVSFKQILSTILVSLLALAPLYYLSTIWGGLVPPLLKSAEGSSFFSISVEHGLLGISYYGILYFVLNPSAIFEYISKTLLIVSSLISIALEVCVKISFLPFSSLFSNSFFKDSLLLYLFPTFFIFIGIYFLATLLSIFLKHIDNKQARLVNLLNLAMALSCFKIIHIFSSRYVAQSSYFALNIYSNPESKRIKIIRFILLIIGSLAGLFSLYIYYKTANLSTMRSTS